MGLLGAVRVVSLLLTAALTFSLTVNQSRTGITLRYPDNSTWIEVCVEQEGKDTVQFYEVNCWEPRFKVEDHKLTPGTIHVRAYLTLREDGSNTNITLHTPVWQVRPEENP